MKRLWVALTALVVVSVVSALTAANVVPATKAGQTQQATDANWLKPAECDALNLTAIVLDGNGTAANELVLGTDQADTLNGGDGDDCIVAGAGDDSLDGGAGTDVCLGGTGTDTYANCETQTDPDPTCSTPGTQTLGASADAYFQEDKPNDNHGTGNEVRVKAESNGKRRRAAVSFSLPALPSGCSVTAATLRLNKSAGGDGRTHDVFRADASWTETGITWANQPGMTGTASTATTAAGYMEWNVTAHVQALYAGTNNGFLIKDANETSANVEVVYKSRENASDNPELVITFG